MPFEAKILIFFLCVFLLVWYINKNPKALVSRILLSWNGPFPKEGEKQYRFAIRWSMYSLQWFVEISIIWGLLFWVFGGSLYEGEPMYVTALLGFALPLAFMVAAAGCIGFLVKSAWFGVFRKNFKFSQEAGKFIERA